MAKVLFFGATKGMGRALSRLMAQRGDQLFLLGRELKELEKSAADLNIRANRSNAVVGHALCDLSQPDDFAAAVQAASQTLGNIDIAVLSAGTFSTQEQLEDDFEATKQLLSLDFTNSILFCEVVRAKLINQGGGTLCAFSSVAGERGRKPVVLYGAAKAGLSHYLEGLDYRYRARGLRVVCIKPGFVKTSMTASLKAPPFASTPEAVAPYILKALDRRKPVQFVTPIWRWIMFVILRLPRFVMRRVSF